MTVTPPAGQYPGNTTAAFFGGLAGRVRWEDFRGGGQFHVNHALNIVINCVDGNHPAVFPSPSQAVGLLSAPTRNVRVAVRSLCTPEAPLNSDSIHPVLNLTVAPATAATATTPAKPATNGLDAYLDKLDATPGTGNLVANGLKEGQYTAPTFEFIFPDNVKPGDGLVPFDFWHLPFIAAGEGATTPWSSTRVGVRSSRLLGKPIARQSVNGAGTFGYPAPFIYQIDQTTGGPQMARTSFPRAALAAFLTAASLTAGCAAPHQTVTAVPSSPSAPIISTQATPSLPPTAAVSGRHGGRAGSTNGSSTALGALPADWPTDLPIPAGDIIGSTGSAGLWSVQIVVAGSAAQVHQSTVAFYIGVGFAAVTDSVLNRGNRQITLVVENRDHSATSTNLVIGVTTR